MKPEHGPRGVIRRHSRSFSLAARLLRPDHRVYVESLYAWCRLVDDAIDLAPTPLQAQEALDEFRDSLNAIYSGGSISGSAALALSFVVRGCSVPKTYPEELLAGMAMDTVGTRFETGDDLLVYCHRVAGVVGLMMCHTLGVTDERALPHAAHLGIAMQLTNVARDVAEDWARGRLYLPTRWLNGTPAVGAPVDDAIMAPAILRVLELADQYYSSGDAGLQYLERRSRFAVGVARAVYSAIGSEIARSGYRASAGRAVVPRWKKSELVVRTFVRECAWRRSAVTVGCRHPLPAWEFRPL